MKPDVHEPFILTLTLTLFYCQNTNHPPQLFYIGNQTVMVGETLTIELTASDPDGDSVSFEARGAPEGSEIKQDEIPNKATFIFSPLISQTTPSGKIYPVTFIAKDGRGGEADETIEIKVLPAWGSPVFISPSGYVLNLAESDRIKFIIEVKDDDTAHVELTLKSGIDGGIFEILDGKSASFFWRPSENQIQQSSFYSIIVGANDGNHPEVIQEIVILLLNANMFEGCAGTNPLVVHNEISDQITLSPYTVSAIVRDEESEIKSVNLFWSTEDPSMVESFKEIEMDQNEGDEFTAFIPNIAQSASSGKMIYYFFKAIDNDDITSSYCDHQTRLPKTGTFSFAAYDPYTYFSCLDDNYEPNDSIETARPLFNGILSGMRACEGNPDYYLIKAYKDNFIYLQAIYEEKEGNLSLSLYDENNSVLVPEGTEISFQAGSSGVYYLKVINSTEIGINYKLSLTVSEKECTADMYEPNNSFLSSSFIGQIDAESLTLCPADVDFFNINLSSGSFLKISLNLNSVGGDIDMALYDETYNLPIKISSGTGDVEEIKFETKEAGTYYLKIYGYDGGSGDYILAVGVSSQIIECEDDLLSPNHNLSSGIAVPEGKYTKLKLCPEQDDYFIFGLNGGETISVLAETEEKNSSIYLKMYFPDGITEFGKSESEGGIAFIEGIAPVQGNYIINVSGNYSVSIPYEMQIEVTDPQGICSPDRLENNNSVKSASSVPQGFTTHLTLCEGDVDYFELELKALESVSVYGFYPDFDSDVHLQLIKINNETGDEEILTEGIYDMEIGEHLFYLAKEKGDYYLKVMSPSDADSVYDIGIYIE